MAKLYLKGQYEPIDIDQEDAKMVKEALDNKLNGEEVIPLAFRSYRLKEIKGVELDQPRTEGNSIDAADEGYFETRKCRVEWSPKDKAGECLDFFSLYCYAKTLQSPTEEENHQAIEVMEKYFTENKDRIFPPVCLFDFINKVPETPLESNLRQGIARMLEKIEQQELYMVERNKNKVF